MHRRPTQRPERNPYEGLVLFAVAAVLLSACASLVGCVGPGVQDPPGRSLDGRPIYPWMSTEAVPVRVLED